MISIQFSSKNSTYLSYFDIFNFNLKIAFYYDSFLM
jgi:hypothetical protein